MAQMANDVANKRSKRKRTFGGCSTCRSRRTKCDEARPVCNTCRIRGLQCGMYDAGLFFDSDKVMGSDSTTRFRRPLMTIEQQTYMSDGLVSLMPPQLVLWHLEQIDAQCDVLPLGREASISRGPFGAFKVSKGTSKQAQVAVNSISVNDPSARWNGQPEVDSMSFNLDSRSSPMLQDAVDPLFEEPDTLQLLDLPGLEASSNRIEEILEDGSPVQNTPGLRSAITPVLGSRMVCPDGAQWLSQSQALSRPASPRTTSTHAELIRDDWVSLLRHYDRTAMRLFTPFSHTKTPWHRLFLPLAKSSFAGVALEEDLDHATLAVLYGTLAISALSLGGTSQSPTWARRSQAYRSHAQRHVALSLETCYSVPKPTKYKTQLMALLTLAHLSLLHHDRAGTESSLLEAEKWIRLRGLQRENKSRKVRLLHHCYAYERIFFEASPITSTSTSNGSSGGSGSNDPRPHTRFANSNRTRSQVRRAVESSPARPHSRDDLGPFRRPAWRDLETGMRRLKTRDQGENDLHLQLPGVWPASLYGEIFGVPEGLVFLVSLVVRLGREREEAEEGDGGGGEGPGRGDAAWEGGVEVPGPERLSLQTFSKAARAIERCIRQQRGVLGEASVEAAHLTRAMYHAVLIYFYRKVRDVDASMLQRQIADVRACLERHDLASPEGGTVCVRLIWPASVAACEAEDPGMREFFAAWFEVRARQSGLRIFNETLADIEQCWREKRSDEAGDFMGTPGLEDWQDLMNMFD